jgi:hypothetical protein
MDILTFKARRVVELLRCCIFALRWVPNRQAVLKIGLLPGELE